jgi:hypothetical protein
MTYLQLIVSGGCVMPKMMLYYRLKEKLASIWRRQVKLLDGTLSPNRSRDGGDGSW